MNLFDKLAAFGSRLRIVEVRQTASSRPVKIETRTVTLVTLTSEIREEEVRALADLPAELSVDLDRIFEAAGIAAAPHGWNSDRLRRAVENESSGGVERKTVQEAVLKRLAAEKVPIEDLVRDAIARDRALDSYEAFARKKLRERAAARERRSADLAAQVAALEAERRRLEAEGRSDEEHFQKWLARKRAAEHELADTVGYLVQDAVITVDDSK